MYWIYLIIFVLIVFAPEYIQHSYFFLAEEDTESVIIFSLSLLAFLLYLAKERALQRMKKEQTRVKREQKVISRDLEDSYSYIGELNRRFDILKKAVGALPGTLAAFGRNAKDENLYRPIFDAVKILSKTESAALYFVHMKEKRIERVSIDGEKSPFVPMTDAMLLREKTRHFWLDGDLYIAASPKVVDHFRSFVVFPKKTNAIDDPEIFKILAAEALFLFCLVRRGGKKETKS